MNNRKPTLPSALGAQLDALAAKKGEARRADDAARWLALSEEAWDLLPDPKTEWDYHPQVMTLAAVSKMPAMGLCDGLDIWIDRLYATHFDPGRQSEYTNLIVGHALFQCNRKDEAVVLFKQVLAQHGAKWFLGEYRPYLELAELP